MSARVPARVSIGIPWWNRSTIIVGLAQIDPQKRLEVEKQRRTGYSTEDHSAGEKCDKTHVVT